MNKKDWWIFLEYLEFGFGINEESFDAVEKITFFF